MKYLLVALIALLVPGLAQAYIGPGAGIGAIGSLIGVLAAIVLAIVGLVWYPLKRILNRRKKDGAKSRDKQKSRQ